MLQHKAANSDKKKYTSLKISMANLTKVLNKASLYKKINMNYPSTQNIILSKQANSINNYETETQGISKTTYMTALLYTIPPFNKLSLSGLCPIVLSSTACTSKKVIELDHFKCL